MPSSEFKAIFWAVSVVLLPPPLFTAPLNDYTILGICCIFSEEKLPRRLRLSFPPPAKRADEVGTNPLLLFTSLERILLELCWDCNTGSTKPLVVSAFEKESRGPPKSPWAAPGTAKALVWGEEPKPPKEWAYPSLAFPPIIALMELCYLSWGKGAD